MVFWHWQNLESRICQNTVIEVDITSWNDPGMEVDVAMRLRRTDLGGTGSCGCLAAVDEFE